MKKVKPLATFRVYPDGRYFYAEVNIWPTKKAMYAHGATGRDYAALCTGQAVWDVPPKKSGRPMRKKGIFAELNFCEQSLGIEVVSHEFTHAGFCFADRKNWDLNSVLGIGHWGGRKTMKPDSVEEQFCYAVGRMANQFTQKCYDIGLYEEVIVEAADEIRQAR